MADNEHSVTIKVNGDATSAERAIAGLRGHVAGLRGHITSVGNALKGAFTFVSKINWVISGIQTIVAAFKKLKDWIHRAEIAAKALREELADRAYETAVANAAAAYERLNRQLRTANELERERNAILEKRRATSRDLEDADIEASRQLEISKLDPASDDYDARKKAVERKYEREASRRAIARSGEDSRAEAAGLERQAKAKDREAAALSRQFGSATATEEKALERSWKAEMAARNGGEAERKKADEAHESWKKAYEFARKIREQMEAAQREAQALRNRAGELAGGSMSAKIRDAATQMRISNEEKEDEANRKKEEEKRKKEEADKKAESAAAQAEHAAKLKKAQNDADFDRDYKDAETPDRYWRLQLRENLARGAFEGFEKQIAEELGKEKPDEKRLAELRRKSEGAQGEMLGYRREQEELDRSEAEAALGRADSALDRSYASGLVSSNRLTALGLGSGVSGNDTMATEMRKVVDLLEKQLAATKENKPEKPGEYSTFSE